MMVAQHSGIYIHIPFCIQKCRYCGFYSIPMTDIEVSDEYCECLIDEMDIQKPLTQHFLNDSVYMGGGTPSILSIRNLRSILDALYNRFSISENAEVTLEVNPATIQKDTARALSDLPVNRISLGVQSFNDDLLTFLGRPHTVDDIYTTYRTLKDSGFESISTDLIFAIPGQSMRDWKQSVRSIIELKPNHVSLYAFSFDRESYFAQLLDEGKIAPVDDDLETRMYLYAVDAMRDAGYIHYEISNFALPGYESRHNRLYWKNMPYIGLGAGAFSYLDRVRYCGVRNIRHYIDRIRAHQSPYVEHERLSDEQSLRETAALNLRLLQEGCSLSELQQMYPDIPVYKELSAPIDTLVSKNLIAQKEPGRFVLTRKGMLFADEAAALIV